MKPRIAVIDDETRLAKILGMMLRREGWEVEVFDDSGMFLATLEEPAWDLVLTDLKMPDVSGLGVLSRVREAAPEIPVVIITAHAPSTTGPTVLVTRSSP